MKTILRFCLLAAIAIFGTGCLTYKEIVNFQDGQDLGPGVVDQITNYQQVRIKPDDILLVNVFSYNIEEAARFNTINVQQQVQAQQMQGAGASVADPIGYRVDSKGSIEMPVIGSVQLAGLTVEEARDLINQKVAGTGYLKDQSIQVRFLSFRVTILGEVNSPGTYTIPSQKVTVLEALGMARDVNLFSNRDNILVIREEGGERKYGRINLKSKDVFTSPYYYLQPNDIVYVEPHKAKILAAPDPASRYLSIVLGLATLITLIVAL